jgi:adenine phosphoribosyltransferase
MDAASLDELRSAVRDIPDFPQPGIVFKDITPVLGDPRLWGIATEALIETAGGQRVDKVVGVDARGFIFGAVVADRLGAGFVPVRKAGKLPWATERREYALEYGTATIEIHRDAIGAGENVLLVDDLLATGGTADAASQLVQQLGGTLIGVSFLIELTALGGRARIAEHAPVYAVIQY